MGERRPFRHIYHKNMASHSIIGMRSTQGIKPSPILFINLKCIDDWEEYFFRSPVEWAESLKQSIREHAKIAIVDLINRANDEIVLVDGVIPFEILERISVPGRCVFLYATMEVVRKDNFRRADKQDMLECIMRLDNPEQAKENVFRASELVYVQDMECVKKSPFTYYIRDVNTYDNRIMQEIEDHFDFSKRASL